jgi:hypothetical protein
VLEIHGGDDVDTGREQILDVLPAFLVLEAGNVGVGEFVYEDDGGPTPENRGKIHLLEVLPPVGDRPAWYDLESRELGGGEGATVGLYETDDNVGTPLGATVPLVEHGEGLTDARGGPEVDPKLSPHHSSSTLGQSVESHVQGENVDHRFAQNTESGLNRRGSDQGPNSRERLVAIRGHSRRLEIGVRERDVGVETRSRRRHGVGGDGYPRRHVIKGAIVRRESPFRGEEIR